MPKSIMKAKPKPKSMKEEIKYFQKMLDKTNIYEKFKNLEKQCKNSEFNALVPRIEIIDELADSMSDYRNSKNKIFNWVDELNKKFKMLENKVIWSINSITEQVNNTTQDFIQEFQNMKHENNGILREFKRSMQKYRTLVKEFEKSPERIQYMNCYKTSRNKTSKSLNKISFKRKNDEKR